MLIQPFYLCVWIPLKPQEFTASFQLLFTDKCLFQVSKNFVRTGRRERSYQRPQGQKGKQPAQPSLRLGLDDGVSEASGLSEQPQQNPVNLMQSSSPAQTYSASLDCVRNVAALISLWQIFIQIRYCSQAEESFSITASWDRAITGTLYFHSLMPTPDEHTHC